MRDLRLIKTKNNEIKIMFILNILCKLRQSNMKFFLYEVPYFILYLAICFGVVFINDFKNTSLINLGIGQF